jgi:RecA/RadA recombinase
MKPFDVAKFRRSLTKNIEGISVGFDDPTLWLDTGCYALNYLISGDFFKGIPMGKFSIFAGAPAAGKSYICSGNLVKNAQDKGMFVILIDTENALDETWLQRLGVNTSEDKLLKLSIGTIDDTAKTITQFIKGYKEEYGDKLKEEQPPVLFIIDSLSMLMSTIEDTQMDGGELKGSIGGSAKPLKSLIKGTLNRIQGLNIGVVATNHTYAAADQYSDPVISGGAGIIYAASIVIGMAPLKLKEDEFGNKVTDVLGIRSNIKVMKSRYAKPFETLQIRIPYSTGMDPYSGLFDLFEKKKLLVKEGNRYTYTSENPEHSFKQFRKNITHDQFMAMMQEFKEEHVVLVPEEEGSEEIEEETE